MNPNKSALQPMAFMHQAMFFDWDTGDMLPNDYQGYVVDYTERNAKNLDSIGAPVYETALNEHGERVWTFIDWTSA